VARLTSGSMTGEILLTANEYAVHVEFTWRHIGAANCDVGCFQLKKANKPKFKFEDHKVKIWCLLAGLIAVSSSSVAETMYGDDIAFSRYKGNYELTANEVGLLMRSIAKYSAPRTVRSINSLKATKLDDGRVRVCGQALIEEQPGRSGNARIKTFYGDLAELPGGPRSFAVFNISDLDLIPNVTAACGGK